MEAVIVIIFFIIAVYILWNCNIARSTGVLIVVLGLAIYVMAHAGREEFQDDTPSVDFLNTDPALLAKAGLMKPSVFDCATEIGISPSNPFYTAPDKVY